MEIQGAVIHCENFQDLTTPTEKKTAFHKFLLVTPISGAKSKVPHPTRHHRKSGLVAKHHNFLQLYQFCTELNLRFAPCGFAPGFRLLPIPAAFHRLLRQVPYPRRIHWANTQGCAILHSAPAAATNASTPYPAPVNFPPKSVLRKSDVAVLCAATLPGSASEFGTRVAHNFLLLLC